MPQIVLLAPGAAMPAKVLIELLADVLEHILFRLPLAHDVTSLALLPDGLRFVSGSYDYTARIAHHGLAAFDA